MITPPPLPVQSLQYDSAVRQRGLDSVLWGIGLVLLGLGALETLSNGMQLGAWLGGWADPFLWNMKRRTAVTGLPSPWTLTIASVAALATGVLAILGGLACLGRRRWARPVLATYATLAIVTRLTVMVARMWPMLERGGPGLDLTSALFSYFASTLAMVGLPVVVLMIVGRRETWRTEG